MPFLPLAKRCVSLRRLARMAAAALLLPALLLPMAAPAALPDPAEAQPGQPSSGGSVSSSLERSAQSVPLDGKLNVAVRSRIETDTPYFEVRFQVLRPSGGVMLQKTEIRHDLTPGDVTVRFERELASLGLRPAAYPLRVRIRASDASGESNEQLLEDVLFLYDREQPPTPVSVVVRLAGVPALDTAGRFVQDPAVYAMERDAALGLARELPAASGRLSVAVAPLLLDQWHRAAAGYSVVGPEGVREVAPGTQVPTAYASALSAFRDLAALERVELLDVPYADPDLAGLKEAGGVGDLDRHFELGISTYIASIEQTPAAGAAVFENRLPPSALPSIARRGLAYALVSPESLRGRDASVTSGAYRVRESTMTALVPDVELGATLVSEKSTGLRRLFDRHLGSDSARPAIVEITLGPGHDAEPADVAALLRTLQAAPWLRTVTCSEAASAPDKRPLRLAEGRPSAKTPSFYWRDVANGRKWAAALSAAAGERDKDAEAAWYDTMLAESGTWAGADGSWGLADRGRAFASAAERIGRKVLDQVSLETQNVTLSGRDGKVPISLSNRSGRVLHVSVKVRSQTLAFPRGAEQMVELMPAENYLTFPVDLRSALSGDIRVSVVSAGMTLREARVTVRASYLDRIVLVFGVVLVLVGILFFVKRRVDAADAGIIEGGGGRQR